MTRFELRDSKWEHRMYSLREQTIKELYEFALNVPGKKTWRITRLAMYRALNNALASHDSPGLKCLAISKKPRILLGIFLG
jgi:hypothetical protein